jgi:hypothetical protein
MCLQEPMVDKALRALAKLARSGLMTQVWVIGLGIVMLLLGYA